MRGTRELPSSTQWRENIDFPCRESCIAVGDESFMHGEPGLRAQNRHIIYFSHWLIDICYFMEPCGKAKQGYVPN